MTGKRLRTCLGEQPAIPKPISGGIEPDGHTAGNMPAMARGMRRYFNVLARRSRQAGMAGDQPHRAGQAHARGGAGVKKFSSRAC
jgi:hypothetical protein